MGTALILFSPVDAAAVKAAAFDQAFQRLRTYRTSWRKQKPLPPGSSLAFISSRGGVLEHNLDDFGKELEEVLTLARAVPGAYLITWLHGRAVHLLHYDSRPPAGLDSRQEDDRPVVAQRADFRLLNLASQRLPKDLNKELDWLWNSPFCADPKLLLGELTADRIDVSAFFGSFGVSGIRDLQSSEPAAIWELLGRVAEPFLRQQEAAREDLKAVNAILREGGDEIRLKAKPAKRLGFTSRAVAEAFDALQECIGEPRQEPWAERNRAAESYWDFSDCADAALRLTTGPRRSLGQSAALGRLMLHYPVALSRSPEFWALAAFVTESANGHAFTEAADAFAESCTTSGITLVIGPRSERDGFRAAMKIHAFDQAPTVTAPWFVEVFLDLPGLVKDSAADKASAWLQKSDLTGLVLRSEVNGQGSYRAPSNGKTPGPIQGEPPPEVYQALSQLDVLSALAILGVDEESIRPGTWQEGAYSGSGSEQPNHEARSLAHKSLADPPSVQVVRDPSYFLRPPHADLSRDRHLVEPWRRLEAFAIRYPETVDLDSIADCRDPVLVDDFWEVWIEGRTIYGGSCNRGTNSLSFTYILGDLPQATEVTICTRSKGVKRYLIDRETDLI